MATTLEIFANVRRIATDAIDKRSSELATVQYAKDIIQLAEELKLIEATRIAQLKSEGPRVSFDGFMLEIVLLRNSKEIILVFHHKDEKIYKVKPEDLKSRETHVLDMPVEDDGFHYFIEGHPGHYRQSHLTTITKEEASILERKIQEVKKKK